MITRGFVASFRPDSQEKALEALKIMQNTKIAELLPQNWRNAEKPDPDVHSQRRRKSEREFVLNVLHAAVPRPWLCSLKLKLALTIWV